MDGFGNITDYTNYLQTQTDASGQKVQDTTAKIGKESTDEELMNACKQFEAYLLEQVFKEMQKTISFGDDEDSGAGLSLASSNALVDYFKDQTIAEVAGNSTERNGLGIAQMLYESMKRQQVDL